MRETPSVNVLMLSRTNFVTHFPEETKTSRRDTKEPPFFISKIAFIVFPAEEFIGYEVSSDF